MGGKQYDSALCPPAFHMSQTIFKDHQMQGINTHTCTLQSIVHTAEMHSHSNCFFVFGRLQWQYVILTLHSTCQQTLFFSLPINWLILLSFHLETACTRIHLQAPVPSFWSHYAEQEEERNIDECMHKRLYLICEIKKKYRKRKKTCVLAYSRQYEELVEKV